MDNAFESKMYRCRHWFGKLLGGDNVQHCCKCQDYKEISESECENCDKFRSLFIEYPITVNNIIHDPITYDDGLYANHIGKPVAVKYCADDKTYLGIFLGELPTSSQAAFKSETGDLTVRHLTNPAMFVPDLNRIVFGYESWWDILETVEDFKEITQQDIDNTWYVQLFKSITKKEENANRY